MSYPINYPTPQRSNFQAFYGGGTTRDWVKPQGVSMVRMLLIGAGAGGRKGNTSFAGAGGGSGAVTQWIGPAMFIPDVLRVSVGAGGLPDGAGGVTTIVYQAKDGAGYTLLTANAGSQSTAGTASSNNFFGAAGIFKSVAGQAGAARGASISASTTNFLCGGASGGTGTTTKGFDVASKYGYPGLTGGAGTTGGNGQDGYFIFQPIMIGQGGAGGGGSTTGQGGVGGKGGIGCGGGGGGLCGSGADSEGGTGGDGAVFIWSW